MNASAINAPPCIATDSKEGATDMSLSGVYRTIFSVLYNESDTFLGSYIENFLAYTGPDEVLFVNLPPDRSIPKDWTTNQCARIHVFNGAVTRHKNGHTLILGHLEGFSKAISQFEDFHLFCSLASNSMMVRRFDIGATLHALQTPRSDAGFDVDNLPDNWWWPTLKKNPDAIRCLRDNWKLKRMWDNRIEGLVATQSDWATLHARSSSIIDMAKLMDPDSLVPLEEFLPSTAICHFGSGQYTNICHVFWDRLRTTQGKVEIGDLLDLPSLYPAHICLMKWFERDAASSETFAVTRSWSRELFADITDATQGGNTNHAHVRRIFLAKIVDAMRKRERFMPITSAWSSGSGAAPGKHVFPKMLLEAQRQKVAISSDIEKRNEPPHAYVLLEKTGHSLELEITIDPGATTSLRLLCNPAGTNVSTGDGPSVLEGYVYLNSCMGPQCSFRIRIPIPLAESQESAVRGVVLAQNSLYRRVAVWHTESAEGYRDYYYRNDVFRDAGEIWFGLPFYTQSSLEGDVDVLIISSRSGA